MRLLQVLGEFNRTEDMSSLGWLMTPPDENAVRAYALFLKQNPNHLGDWSSPEAPAWGTKKLEREVVGMMCGLYKTDSSGIGGYMTSGGTEGNLYAAWLGKSMLIRHCSADAISVLSTSLTHYSIRKIASIMSLAHTVVPLSDRWNMDPDALERTVAALYRKGKRGFLIPLTHGYTATGTSDPVPSVSKAIRRIKKTHPGAHFFVWIDAAFQGMVTPFAENDYRPFDDPAVSAYVVDFHKFAGAPYASGLVLYRRRLSRYVNTPIDYLPESDSTVSGSRPGAPSAAAWSLIKAKGYSGFEQTVKSQLAHKDYLIAQIRRELPETVVITERHTLTCGFIFRSLPRQAVPEDISNTYGLFAKPVRYLFGEGARTERVYKIHLLPHVTRTLLHGFVRDLSGYAKRKDVATIRRG